MKDFFSIKLLEIIVAVACVAAVTIVIVALFRILLSSHAYMDLSSRVAAFAATVLAAAIALTIPVIGLLLVKHFTKGGKWFFIWITLQSTFPP